MAVNHRPHMIEAVDGVCEALRAEILEDLRRLAPEGLDAALFLAGGKAAERALTAVREGGRVAHPNGIQPPLQTTQPVAVSTYDVVIDREAFEKLNRLIEDGPFEVHVARTFPLDQAADAHRALDDHYLGKMGLRPK